MIEKAKYVILRYEPMGGIIMPLALPEALEHVAAKAVGAPVSAGFFGVDRDGTFRVWGESKGLGLASRPQDAEILRVWFRPRRRDGDFMQDRSTVDHRTHNPEIVGSIPTPAPNLTRCPDRDARDGVAGNKGPAAD